jgi:hypothetical protein
LLAAATADAVPQGRWPGFGSSGVAPVSQKGFLLLGLNRSAAVAGGVLLCVLSVAGRAAGADYTYAFTGQVTAVENPNGFFTAPAVVGAPVAGSFTYTDTPDNPPFSPNPSFTNYLNGGSGEPQTTGIVLSVGGAEARSGPSSLANMIVGDNNAADTFPPFFPVGDSFRYQDSLDRASPLFDFPAAELFQSPYAVVFLTDPAGTAFGSQALPSGLPLSGLGSRSGIIYIDDDNFETTGRLSFRIDSIRAVPEPVAPTLLAAAGLGLATRRRRR